MLLSDLYGARVESRDGRSQGRVRELLCDGGEVTHLGVGAISWIERMTGGRRGRRIPWSAVVARKGDTVVVDL